MSEGQGSGKPRGGSAGGARILVVDDTPANLSVLSELLEREGHRVSVALDGAQALALAPEVRPELILLDVTMPGLDGYEVCRRLKREPQSAGIPVIFVTARDLSESVVAGFAAGGVEYITKPFREPEVLARVSAHLRLAQLGRQLEERNRALAEKVEELAARNAELEEAIAQRRRLRGQLSLLSAQEEERWGLEGFVGRSPTLRRIFEEVHLLQESRATAVLITGESGTGKELIARALHFGSPRRSGPFVALNCAALPRELVESLLFGHARGAFTGADADRAGYFEMAHEGTLFLDEIGEMPVELQAKLLRVLEDGEVTRLGERHARRVDARVVAATNQDLLRRTAEGRFRQDLYYRLARFTVVAPPLRERPEDIPLLAAHFLRRFAAEMGRESPALSPEAQTVLQAHPYPGNVRELKNALERALIECRGDEVRPEHIHLAAEYDPAAGGAGSAAALPLDLEAAVELTEQTLVRRALDRTGGNIAEAARLLGTNRNRVYRILEQGRRPAG